MSVYVKGDTMFEAGSELIDVTSSHRTDTSWRFTDAAGHIHQWWDKGDGKPAGAYNPNNKYYIPSVEVVSDGKGYWEDGDEYEKWHYECKECRQHITPGYTADTTKQYISGLRWFKIDGQYVTPEEFKRRFEEIHGKPL